MPKKQAVVEITWNRNQPSSSMINVPVILQISISRCQSALDRDPDVSASNCDNRSARITKRYIRDEEF